MNGKLFSICWIFDFKENSICYTLLQLRNADFKVYGEYCGNSLPRGFDFYRGSAKMLFVSDRSKNKDGFKLTYQGTHSEFT
jgi:hypothetical protein